MIHFAKTQFLTHRPRYVLALTLITLLGVSIQAQTASTATGTLRGTVTLGDSGKPIHNVLITVLQLKRTVGTDDSGNYEFQNLPPGKYEVLAHLDRVPDIVQTVQVTPGASASLDFQVQLGGLQEQVTVTATGTEQSISSSIQSVEVIGSVADVVPYYDRASICVAPLRAGGGTRLKILEVLAAGAAAAIRTSQHLDLPLRLR